MTISPFASSATSSALAVALVSAGAAFFGCNAVWGIDELDYERGASAPSGGAAGTGGANFGLGGVGGGAGAVFGAAGSGPAGGGGGDSCALGCATPPNLECYDPVGLCDPQTGSCSYSPLADGTSCAATTCGDWSACAWDGECANTGSRARACTDYGCVVGTCTPSGRQEGEGCSRTVGNGTDCSAGYCCSNSCVARNANNHCGSCGIDCNSGESCVEITGRPGAYTCTCYSTAICKDIGFGSDATCYAYNGQTICDCQCGAQATCTGQCAGGGICTMINPGHNYCHY